MAKHDHCTDCGACLLSPAQLHKCPAFSMDKDIKDVFNADSSRGLHQTSGLSEMQTACGGWSTSQPPNTLE